jgi:hypothetical protein
MAINDATTAGQVLTSAYVNNMPRGVISYVRDTTGSLNVNDTNVHELFRAPAFTPVAGRLYSVTYAVGFASKDDNIGNVDVQIRKDSISGTVLDSVVFSAVPLGQLLPMTKVVALTTTQMGTTSFVPMVTVVSNNVGFIVTNSATYAGTIIIEDIGAA